MLFLDWFFTKCMPLSPKSRGRSYKNIDVDSPLFLLLLSSLPCQEPFLYCLCWRLISCAFFSYLLRMVFYGMCPFMSYFAQCLLSKIYPWDLPYVIIPKRYTEMQSVTNSLTFLLLLYIWFKALRISRTMNVMAQDLWHVPREWHDRKYFQLH